VRPRLYEDPPAPDRNSGAFL